MKTSFEIRNVVFPNRVFVASGTFGYGDEVKNLVDVNKLGGIITKSLSLKPREGNPPRRIIETPSGMLNSIGLANIGVEKFIQEKLPILRELDTRIIVNIAASTIDEYAQVLERLKDHEDVDAFEINVSCPNVKEGGLSFGTDPRKIAEITRRLRSLTDKPLLVKLTPNVTRIAECARAAEESGADAISAINTIVGMAVDIVSRKPKLSTITGGLSGPAIRPIALAKVYEISNAVKIPIIGIGGIASAEDALEFLIAGASAVQIGTMNFVNPDTAVKIVEGIHEFSKKHNLKDVGELVGTLDADYCVSPLNTWK